MTCAVCLSVGVPVYNQGELLGATLRSLLNQTETPLEIVVSDNHSTDRTPEVLREFAGSVKIVRPPHHMDMADHWNFLAGHLRGEWFTLLSSDDLAMPNFVATLCRGAGRVPDAVLVRSGFIRIDAEGRSLSEQYILSVKRVTRAPQTMREQLLGPKGGFPAFAIRRSAFERAGGFPSLHLFGDWGMWLRLAPMGAFVYEHSLISKYRTAYRPGLDRERLPLELEDETAISTDIIPSVARQIPEITPTEQLRASRARLTNAIGKASRTLGPQQRELRNEAAERLGDWAKSVGCQRALDDFASGNVVRQIRRPSALRRVLRSLYQRVRT